MTPRSSTISKLPELLRTDVPFQRAQAFARRFGEPHTRLALHAALPLGLTPELVHLLRVNFTPDVPWIAEADLLLSPLCREVGGGAYQMDPPVQELLVNELQRDPEFGPSRVVAIAEFLLAYTRQLMREAGRPEVWDFLVAQQWAALAYVRPREAAKALASALRQELDAGNQAETILIAGLTQALTAPLITEEKVLLYAAGVEQLAMGNSTRALNLFDTIGPRDESPDVEGVSLPTANELLERIQAPPTPISESSDARAERKLVYISYSRKDREWMERLRLHLLPLVHDGLIDVWDDTRLRAGQNWFGEIRRRAQEAAVAILLVSADFLASDFIAGNELPPLLDAAESEGVLILPVILKPSLFAETPLARFQAMNSPNRPLVNMTKPEQEALFVRVAGVIQSHLEGRTEEAQEVAPLAGTTEAASEHSLLHFYVEIEQEVTADEKTTLTVVVSRKAVGEVAGRVTATVSADVEARREITLDIRPRRNFEVVGELRAEVDPPEPDAPVERFFDVRPTHAGEGEVWVIARQGLVPIATLRLKVRIAGAGERTERRRRTKGSARREPEAAAMPNPIEPLCQLRIFERRRGDEFSHEYELEIPSKILERYESLPFRTSREDYVHGLYRQIEERWLSCEGDEEMFTEELRAMGGSLFEQLFPEPLQRTLWEHRDEINNLQVISTEPFIPWELVHLKEPGGTLPFETRFLAQMGLVRWLHGSWFPERLRVRAGRARYVVPDYPEAQYKLPEAQQEIAFLEQRFGAEAVEPTPQAVRQLLRGPAAFDLLHFTCHAASESEEAAHVALMLEDRKENGHTVHTSLSVTTVGEHSRLVGEDGSRPMVVLNACQVGRPGFQVTKVGGFATAFLGGGAGAFVGSHWPVTDYAARIFTETLYEALLEGRTLGEAAVAAREAAREDGGGSWLAYGVYGHPHARLELESPSDTFNRATP